MSEIEFTVDEAALKIIKQRHILVDMALSGLRADSMECQLEPEHIEAVHSAYMDLWASVREVLLPE